MKVTRFCPAKVNLFLEVTGRRPNGYHELATLFAKIGLGDRLTVSAQEEENTSLSLKLTGPVGRYLRADESNLVCRAARGFLEHFGLNARIELTLDKHVPTGAGLGGGSSDAANTLLALCEIFRRDKNELLSLAASLGADVPLFMYEETFLHGEGIGEILTPVAAPGPLPGLVLVYPDAFISTKNVFDHFHLPAASEIQQHTHQLTHLISQLQQGAAWTTWAADLFNRLEEQVVPVSLPVQRALADLKAAGAKTVLMSGSGSTVFALTDTLDEAQQIAKHVRKPGRTIFYTSFYPSHPTEK